MFKLANPLFLICETPMHVGSGNDLGVIDLPIQRERHTLFPKVEASSLKGALRQAFELNREGRKFKLVDTSEDIDINANDYKYIEYVFGPEEGDLYAGAMGVTDARLFFFPVKSMKGVFAWVTCKKALTQFKRDMALVGVTVNINLDVQDGECLIHSNSSLSIDGHVCLEEYTFKVQKNNNGQINLDGFISINSINQESQFLGKYLAEKLFPHNDMSFWSDKIQKDIVVLSDNDFSDFVNLSTEVITRIKIDNQTGTVANGQLFTEEYLPSESILYSLFLSSDVFIDKKKRLEIQTAENVQAFFEAGLPSIMQIGANTTLGKGLVRTKLITFKP